MTVAAGELTGRPEITGILEPAGAAGERAGSNRIELPAGRYGYTVALVGLQVSVDPWAGAVGASTTQAC